MAAFEANRKGTFHLCISFTLLFLMLFQVDTGSYQTTATLSPNSPIYAPRVPILLTLSRRLRVGSVLRIYGAIPANSNTFQINLCSDCEAGPIHLHISVRFSEEIVVRNSYVNGKWNTEDRTSLQDNFPFSFNQEFVLLIEVKANGYYISVNGQHAWQFAHKVSYTTVKKLEISGGSIVIPKVELTDVDHLADRNRYHFNGQVTDDRNIHLVQGSSGSGTLEKFLLDLRCECTPQNSSSVSQPLGRK